ncbi:LLM class flavin-dependent oxidoreductase [Streptomyces fractus]|uniref:LLM class flavin-dependent oxidoreductase n=1 Tax=Streptomyces fractus TaxID=641806 RepID=UPI003CEE8245
MRFDLLHTFANAAGAPWRQVLERGRRRIALADELGLDGFWLGEHHFDHAGQDQSPNPVLLLADLASRTERIRVGTAAVILPLWHPLRLAEDLAALDNMVDGRLDVALSRGILQAEIINLNAEADRKDPERSKAIFEEFLGLLRTAWSQDPLAWKSERFEVPNPDTNWPGALAGPYTDDEGRATGLAILPRPAQTDGPRLYSVTDTPDGFATAARQGLDVITWFPTGGVLDRLNTVYAETVAGNGGPASAAPRSCAVLRRMHVARTDEEARAAVEGAVTSTVEYISKVRGLGIWLDEGESVDDPAVQGKAPFDLLFERDHLLVGSPETVAEKMTSMVRDRHVDHFVMSPYLTEDEQAVEASLRLCATEVIPAVKWLY